MARQRISMARKKEILREYLAGNHGESQTQFCRRLGLGESMFSKWLRARDDILATSDTRVNRDTNRDVREEKRLLRECVQAAQARGDDVKVLHVMRMAARVAPQIFATVKNYNGQYVMCQRLLREFVGQPPTSENDKRSQNNTTEAAPRDVGGAASPVDSTSARSGGGSSDISDATVEKHLIDEFDSNEAESASSSGGSPVAFRADDDDVLFYTSYQGRAFAFDDEDDAGVGRDVAAPSAPPSNFTQLELPSRNLPTLQFVDANIFTDGDEESVRILDDTVQYSCDASCSNRHMFFECGPWNCRAKKCTNRAFQTGSVYMPYLELFETQRTGLGARCRVPIPAGAFVVEYVGEYMNKTKFYAERYSPADTYFLESDYGYGIDARLFGNISRFVNHSCIPNLKTVRFVVHGITRVGFSARRDISTGEELTMDYRVKDFICKCPFCSPTLV